MALLSRDDLDVFKGDRVCEIIGGTPFYGNVTGARVEDGVKKTKLWNIKFDHGEEEEVTLSQLMGYQKKYERHKQYDTEANKKRPATTTAPTLPALKKKKSTVVAKRRHQQRRRRHQSRRKRKR